MSRGSEETARYLPASGVMVSIAIGYTMSASLVRIKGNLNADRYISDIFLPVVMPYLRVLTNVIFQQDNSKPNVAYCVLTFLDTQDIQLLPWSVRSPCHPLKTSNRGLSEK